MAKFTPGAIISEIRGSIAATTYSRSPAGAYVKAKLIQTNPNTPAQQAVRALTAAAVSAWQTVAQSVRDEWIAFSATQKSRARIDGTHKLSGYNSFIRFYVVRNQYGLVGNPVPAPQQPIGSYTNMSVSSTPGSLDVTIEGNNTNPDIFAVLRMSDGVSQGINSINQSLQKITAQVQAPNFLIDVNVIALWESIYGPFANAAGKKIFLRIDIVNRLTAQIVTVFRGFTIVPEPVAFLAVSFSGTPNRIMISTDGISWSTATNAPNLAWRGAAYSPALGLFVVVGASGAGTRAMTSPDGLNWTLQNTPVDNFWVSVAWSPILNLFAAISFLPGTNQIMTSPDGVAWTIRVTPNIAFNNSIIWDSVSNLFLATSGTGAGNNLMTSVDGINWLAGLAPANNGWSFTVSAGSLGLAVAVGISGFPNQVMTSPDGINWTLRNSAADQQWISVAWSPTLNLLAAVSSTGVGTRIMTSPDGINWTLRNTPVDNAFSEVAWSPEVSLFAAVSNNGTNDQIMTSPDGINWTIQVTPDNNTWFSMIGL